MKRTQLDLMVHLIPDYMRTTIKIPEIQREPKIWTLEQKQNLIDSLYNDFDIPKIYFRKKVEEENIWWLIDGQQRLTTVVEFLNNEFNLGDASTLPVGIHEKKFGDLIPSEKGKITGRTLNCIMVECDDEEEEDMFTRLNNGTPLSAAEKRNAMRGDVKDSVKNIARHGFLRDKVNFTSKRYAYDAICAQLTVLCLAGGPTDTKGKSLKKLYEVKKIYPERKNVEKKIRKILNLMNRIFVSKEPYMKKYNVISVYLFFQELLDNFAISNIKEGFWYKFFNDFEAARIHNSRISEDDSSFDYDINGYQFSCVNSPDSEQGIRVRHDVLLKRFFAKFPGIEPKDCQRNFCEHQKLAIYFLKEKKCCGVTGFKCPSVGKVLLFEECEFDHIKEHTSGGKTTVDNGQILCFECHKYKTSSFMKKSKE